MKGINRSLRKDEVMMKVEKRLGVAYGSNLNIGQMAMRRPKDKLYGKGVLKGY